MRTPKKPVLPLIKLEDYKPPVFLVESVALDFDIRGKKVRVKSKLCVRRNPESVEADAPLWLDGEELKFISLCVDGKKRTARTFALSEKGLSVQGIGESAVIEIENEIEPDKNLALLGLYRAGELMTSQCESEGFRRITFYPDRPDVSSSFTVTIHADKERYPFLLSNGNRVAAGNEEGGRHFVRWVDPFKKPCYLFALVAGQMDRETTSFVTKSGRRVAIEVYTDPGRGKETGFLLEAIPTAMKWDEKTYGLEYDLDLFMLVAVSAFNYGAMENKGLNIFNDNCALGLPETATDTDISYFERVVGHEYFHNYTGDRVTCRDWFQISLKEGLTVFREQEFCADRTSRVLERIKTVSELRYRQFVEDAGAMAHPVRPKAYSAVDNFYTMTVYRKGAEIVRMLQTMVGEKGFRKGLRLYLKQHDGSCATCDDFVAAMGEANGIDLSPFMLWYEQAGTPVLTIRSSFNKKKQEYVLKISQACPPTPGQRTKKPMPMPIAIGLLDKKTGEDCVGTLVLDVREKAETFIIKGVREEPVPSLLRGFSAPVRLDYPFKDAQLYFLIAQDPDLFNRWESAQKLYTKFVLAGRKAPAALIETLEAVLADRKLEAGFKAALLSLPSDDELGLSLCAAGKKLDPMMLHVNAEKLRVSLAKGLEGALRKEAAKIAARLDPKAADAKSQGKRHLKNVCLALLSRLGKEEDLQALYTLAMESSNMTDKNEALSVLASVPGALRDAALADFEKKFSGKPTVMDDWLGFQSAARKPDVVDDVKRLLKHPAFTIRNPNRVRGLFRPFVINPFGFHALDGRGYKLVADIIPSVDALNPHVASDLLKAFLRWKEFEPKRRALMKASLLRLSRVRGLSPNSREMILNGLGK